MRIAIFSDIHDNDAGLQAVLADAERRNADRLIFLGDLGNDERLFETLQRLGVDCLFGNWEVSGLQRLSLPVHDWVSGWPSTLQEESAIFCHATPDMPAQADTTQDAATYMQQGVRWQQLFPRLHREESALWNALAVMEDEDVQVTFHGHTHVQMAWGWCVGAHGENYKYGRRLQSWISLDELQLMSGRDDLPNRYIVGVGSAGQPDDGPALKYAMYEPEQKMIRFHRI
jgi:predicted phosphodiesterase